jgi:hypothetical protein
LDDDERLDALLDQLQKRAPTVPPARKQARAAGGPAAPAAPARRRDAREESGGDSGNGHDTGSGARSVTSQLASEVRAVRRQLEELGKRAAAKAERQGVVAGSTAHRALCGAREAVL